MKNWQRATFPLKHVSNFVINETAMKENIIQSLIKNDGLHRWKNLSKNEEGKNKYIREQMSL